MSKKPSPNFDDTRQYKSERDSSKEVKEYCSTCGEVHGRECPEYYKVIQLDSILHGEDLKLECDHIVALREVMSVICLPLSKLKELSDLHKKDGTWEEIFYWLGEEECTSRECPLCCEKLDWEAIEKQLNT